MKYRVIMYLYRKRVLVLKPKPTPNLNWSYIMGKKNEQTTAGAEQKTDTTQFRARLQTAARMSAFGDETRVGIITFLLSGPKNVGDIADAVGIPVVNASHHLNKLKQAGLVEDEKQGRFVIYTLNPALTTKTNGKTTRTVLNMGLCSVVFES